MERIIVVIIIIPQRSHRPHLTADNHLLSSSNWLEKLSSSTFERPSRTLVEMNSRWLMRRKKLGPINRTRNSRNGWKRATRWREQGQQSSTCKMKDSTLGEISRIKLQGHQGIRCCCWWWWGSGVEKEKGHDNSSSASFSGSRMCKGKKVPID